MRPTSVFLFQIAITVSLGLPLAAPEARSDTASEPVRIGTSNANYGTTLAMPRWKGHMLESNPDQFWATWSNGGRSRTNIAYTTDGGESWSSNPIQIDPLGYLDMHAAIAGRNGELYATWPGRDGIAFRKFNAPAHSNEDAESPIIFSGTTRYHRSNIMVEDNGRIWVFTRRTGSPSENVRYHYSDDGGSTWIDGMAFNTNASSIRFGSMPYIDGRPALIVLYLDSPRGYEYYLWNGSEFEAMPDHSIYPENVGYHRAFTHNVVSETAFHLVFGLGNELHHVWKNYNDGAGSWTHEVIDNSPNTENNDWYPVSTVRGDDLYVFYSRKSTSDNASADIYYRKWSQASQSWTSPELISTDPGMSANRHPNTTMRIPEGASYIPVFWQSEGGPYDINFARIDLGTDPSQPPAIDCPSNIVTATDCGDGNGCVPLAISNCDSVTVEPATAVWTDGQLTVPIDSAGTFDYTITGYPSDPAYDPVTCNLTVEVPSVPTVAMTCPDDTLAFQSCYPAMFTTELIITNETTVDVTGATWSDNELSFSADTTGMYLFTVTAGNEYGTESCDLVADVRIWPSVDLSVSDSDLAVSEAVVQPGDTVMLTAIVRSNPNSTMASDIEVMFYNGDPEHNGTMIATQPILSLDGGASDTLHVAYVVSDTLTHDVYVAIDLDQSIAECNEQNNTAMITVETIAPDDTGDGDNYGSVQGTVSADASPVYGVMIELLNENGALLHSAVSDQSGRYRFDSIPAGDFLLDLQVPLGYGPVGSPTVPLTIGDQNANVDFTLRDAASGNAADFWWWKREFDDLRNGVEPGSQLTIDEVDSLGGTIFDHFYDRTDGHGIELAGVTCIGSPPRPLTFGGIEELWFEIEDNSYEARTRKYFLACLLNIATGRRSQQDIVSADGATASQAITYFADRYMAGDSTEVYLWYNLRAMFTDDLIESGLIPLNTSNVLFKPGDSDSNGTLPAAFTLSQNFPNPFNPTTTIAYYLPERSDVRIEIFNVLGRRVRTLVSGEVPAGSHEVVWDGTDHNGGPVGSGVYLYRISAGELSDTKKMLMLK